MVSVNINDVNLANYDKCNTGLVKPNVTLYRNETTYVKLWTDAHLDPHTLMVGLSTSWCGYDQLTTQTVGFIRPDICPCFIDTIHDGNRCCGYITHAGEPLTNPLNQLKFLMHLATVSIDIGYCLPDMHAGNLITYNGQPSIIDLDVLPADIASYHSLTCQEQAAWVREVSQSDTFAGNQSTYLSLVLNSMR